MEITGIGYLMPILSFILIFAIVYAVLAKTKLFGENNFVYGLISLVLALIFVLTPLAREFTIAATPTIVVFLIATFLILFIIAFIRGDISDIVKDSRLSQAALIILLLIFLVAGILVFGPVLEPYMPWANETIKETASTGGTKFTEFFFHPSIMGTLVLFIVAALVAWLLGKTK